MSISHLNNKYFYNVNCNFQENIHLFNTRDLNDLIRKKTLQPTMMNKVCRFPHKTILEYKTYKLDINEIFDHFNERKKRRNVVKQWRNEQ